MGKPKFKKSHKAWYCVLGGETIKLAKAESEAHARYSEILDGKPFFKQKAKVWLCYRYGEIGPAAGPEPAQAGTEPVPAAQASAPTGPTLAFLVEKFCEHVIANCPKGTMLAYTRYSRKWATHHGHLPATEIAGHHITEAGNKLYPKVNPNGTSYSDSVRCQHAKTAKQVFVFAKSEGYIKFNPVEGYRSKVKWGKREVDLSKEDFEKLLAACDDPIFRDVLIVLYDCGCRPAEAFEARAANLDRAEKCLRYAKGKGGKPRVVILTDRAFEIMARLADQFPEGSVLLKNQIGEKWSIATAGRRLLVLEAKTSVKATCYTFRHAFITRHVKNGTNLVSLMHLAGHTSLKMISEVYAHLGGDSKGLRAALCGAA